MSDRRRYDLIDDGFDSFSIGPYTRGRWYHESAVRELVEALAAGHTTQEGVSVCAYIPEPCPICAILTHYEELLGE